jgi:4-alpha-glucanotransferase
LPPTPVDSIQPSEDYNSALSGAAVSWGIEPEYFDIWGNRHHAASEVQQSILRSLGVSTESKEDLDAARENRLWKQWSSVVESTIVVGVESHEIPIQIADAQAEATVEALFAFEDGRLAQSTFSLSSLPDGDRAAIRGENFIRKYVPLPAAVPLGYHKVEVRIISSGGVLTTGSSRLIVCPERAYSPPGRSAGIAVSLYSLRSGRNWGCGDFADLYKLIDWAVTDVDASFIGLNPLHAIPNRQPYNTSPYLPVCTFYRNPLYLDVERVEDFAKSARAHRMFESEKMQCEIAALRDTQYVEYERVYRLKMRFMKMLFRRFVREMRANTPRAAEFRAYIQAEGYLLDRFAVFCALDEAIHKQNKNIWIWPDWPEEYRDPESDATQAFARQHWRSVLFYKYVQWQVDLQLRDVQHYAKQQGLPIGLYHDLALATDRCGSDLWAHRPFYVDGCRVGSPPDGFSPKGQDWAFPPPNGPRHKEDGYRLFAESIRKNCKHGGALRIDHVMRFFRLYWIPDGVDATNGTYVKDAWEDLIRILALESVRNQVVIVGEDLGTVEPEVREALKRFGILSYRLLYFEKNSSGDFKLPHEYPEKALVSVSTHDLPTLAGFWTGRDIEARRAAGLLTDEASYREQLAQREQEKQKMLDAFWKVGLLPEGYPREAWAIPEFTGELHYAAIGFLTSTPSELMVLNQEDLFKEADQQNLPGSTEQYPNWRHKMQVSLEELSTLKTARDCTAMYRYWIEKTNRGRVAGVTPILAEAP